jgi:hypothetical protein
MAYTSHSHDSGERRPSNEDGLRSTPEKERAAHDGVPLQPGG